MIVPALDRCHLAVWQIMACFGLLVGMATAAAAATDRVDLETLEELAFRAAVARVAPSVVRIETLGGDRAVATATASRDNPTTTGLIVDARGYIVSSAYGLVHRPDSILVQLANGTRHAATHVATDHARKIVLLKIDAKRPLPVAEIAPVDTIRVGQWAIAVGRTFEAKRPNLSVGVVSATGRIWGKALQCDAAVSPNNYGGPLVDIEGRVLGVLVPLSPEASEETAGLAWYDSGIGFAIDAQHIMKILPRWIKGDDLQPGLLGIELPPTHPAIAEPLIAACNAKGPAAKAGLRTGDRIVAIDGRKIKRAADVKRAVAVGYAGDSMRVVVVRNGKRIEVSLELAAKIDRM